MLGQRRPVRNHHPANTGIMQIRFSRFLFSQISHNRLNRFCIFAKRLWMVEHPCIELSSGKISAAQTQKDIRQHRGQFTGHVRPAGQAGEKILFCSTNRARPFQAFDPEKGNIIITGIPFQVYQDGEPEIIILNPGIECKPCQDAGHSGRYLSGAERPEQEGIKQPDRPGIVFSCFGRNSGPLPGFPFPDQPGQYFFSRNIKAETDRRHGPHG